MSILSAGLSPKPSRSPRTSSLLPPAKRYFPRAQSSLTPEQTPSMAPRGKTREEGSSPTASSLSLKTTLLSSSPRGERTLSKASGSLSLRTHSSSSRSCSRAARHHPSIAAVSTSQPSTPGDSRSPRAARAAASLPERRSPSTCSETFLGSSFTGTPPPRSCRFPRREGSACPQAQAPRASPGWDRSRRGSQAALPPDRPGWGPP